jgi:hypothetical protein
MIVLSIAISNNPFKSRNCYFNPHDDGDLIAIVIYYIFWIPKSMPHTMDYHIVLSNDLPNLVALAIESLDAFK